MKTTIQYLGILLSGWMLINCAAAIPLPPPWLFLIQHPHTPSEEKPVPYSTAGFYPSPLPTPEDSLVSSSIAWADPASGFSRRPEPSRHHEYHPSVR